MFGRAAKAAVCVGRGYELGGNEVRQFVGMISKAAWVGLFTDSKENFFVMPYEHV